MRGTQNPHIVSCEGVVAVSRQAVPAPAISPLGEDFIGQLERVRAALDSLHPGALELYRFASLGEFTEVMIHLIQTTEPFSLAYGG
jgi:CRISPR-associated protein Cst2